MDRKTPISGTSHGGGYVRPVLASTPRGVKIMRLIAWWPTVTIGILTGLLATPLVSWIIIESFGGHNRHNHMLEMSGKLVFFDSDFDLVNIKDKKQYSLYL